MKTGYALCDDCARIAIVFADRYLLQKPIDFEALCTPLLVPTHCINCGEFTTDNYTEKSIDTAKEILDVYKTIGGGFLP